MTYAAVPALRRQPELAKVYEPLLTSREYELVELMALALQGSLLVRHAPPAVADAFCASRLGGDWGHAAGRYGRGRDPGTGPARPGLTPAADRHGPIPLGCQWRGADS
jgi:hypothetical protein